MKTIICKLCNITQHYRDDIPDEQLQDCEYCGSTDIIKKTNGQ